MSIGDFFARLGGRAEPEPELTTPRAPTADDVLAALERAEASVATAPGVVSARVQRVTATVRDTLPKLAEIGLGSDQGYAVMATATEYLPEAVNSYLRLPRRFADSRPVDGQKSSLMVLVDQLDLLGATMDQVFDAVHREDATALVAHARFLDDKFGHRSRGGALEVGAGVPLPDMPDLPGESAMTPGDPSGDGSPMPPTPSTGGTVGEPARPSSPEGDDRSTEAGAPPPATAARDPFAPLQPPTL